MIYIVGTTIAFFLFLLLLSKKGKILADKILTVWLFLMGIHLLLFYLSYAEISYQYPFLLGIIMPFPLLHGPFLLLYTASLTNQLGSRKKFWPLHFIPAIICWFYMIRFFVLPDDQKIYIFKNKGIGFETFILINLVAIVLSGITYVTWSLVLLRRHRRAILDQFSYTEKINLRWLQLLIYGIAGIWLLVFVSDDILFIGVVLFILLIGYFGIRQTGIFLKQPVSRENSVEAEHSTDRPAQVFEKDPSINRTGQNIQDPDTTVSEILNTGSGGLTRSDHPDDPLERKKYSKSGLTTEMANNLHKRLSDLMVSEKIYTESELSLSDLADHLHTLPNYLSQVINEKEGKNFYDYINMLRIEEFKRLASLPDSRQYTLLSMSFDCGFNSKSSFNKNFKKFTGQSPSEFFSHLNLEKTF
jgi:AraC-like DNA-binding protein